MTDTNEADPGGSLANQLLVAMPDLTGSIFANSVVYICDHNKDGAMGLIVNVPLDIQASQIFDQLGIGPQTENPKKGQPVFCGGPVSVDNGFVLHRKHCKAWESTLDISPEVSLTTSRDIVDDLARGDGPPDAMIILGYAGWGPGQLESEIKENAWLIAPSYPELLFNAPPEERASLAVAQLGIELPQLSGSVGHA
ncbi:MAG: YqgE/AlgH family protein [bacterium]